MYKTTILTISTTLMILVGACTVHSVPDLSPANWEPGVYDRFMAAQDVDRTQAGFARGHNGAVTVAYSGLAAQAGLEALRQGGNAIDGAMTAAMTQIALTAGAPISMSLPTSDGGSILGVPEGRFDADVLEASGLDYREVPNEEARLGGEGKWIAISRDPETGLLEAASHNRNNSDAVAF